MSCKIKFTMLISAVSRLIAEGLLYLDFMTIRLCYLDTEYCMCENDYDTVWGDKVCNANFCK